MLPWCSTRKMTDWFLQGGPGTFLGLRSELGQPHRGEGGTVPQRNSWSSSLPARLEDSAPRPQSKWWLMSFTFPHKQPTSLLMLSKWIKIKNVSLQKNKNGKLFKYKNSCFCSLRTLWWNMHPRSRWSSWRTLVTPCNSIQPLRTSILCWGAQSSLLLSWSSGSLPRWRRTSGV